MFCYFYVAFAVPLSVSLLLLFNCLKLSYLRFDILKSKNMRSSADGQMLNTFSKYFLNASFIIDHNWLPIFAKLYLFLTSSQIGHICYISLFGNGGNFWRSWKQTLNDTTKYDAMFKRLQIWLVRALIERTCLAIKLFLFWSTTICIIAKII